MKHPARWFLFRPAALCLLSALGSPALAKGQDLVRDTTTGETERVVVTGQSPEEELPALDATTATRLPARILDTVSAVKVSSDGCRSAACRIA